VLESGGHTTGGGLGQSAWSAVVRGAKPPEAGSLLAFPDPLSKKWGSVDPLDPVPVLLECMVWLAIDLRRTRTQHKNFS